MCGFSRVTLLLALSALVYFGSYFFMVRRGIADCGSGVWVAQAEYRFDSIPEFSGAATIYQLAHFLDRHIFRPSLWAGTYDTVALITASLGIRCAKN